MVVCGSLLSVRLARSAAAAEVGQRLRIAARVVAVLRLELVGDVIDDAIVPVLAAQAHVAFDGQRLEVLLRQADQRHVEGAAAQVVDQHGALLAAAAGSAGSLVPPVLRL